MAHRRHRLHKARAGAIRTRLAQGALQRLLHALAGDRHQSEIVELENLRRRAIVAQRFFQRHHHLLAILALVHVDEVDDDDAAQIAQPDLPHDFLDGIDVDLHDGVFQPLRLADKLAGVDVDGHQRLGLVDDDVAAALQPHFRLQRAVDLFLDAELLEQRRVFGVELDAADQRRLEAVGEAHHALVLVFGVHPDLREVGVDLVAQHALHQVEVVIDQRRRLAVLGAVLDLGPQMLQEADVGAQIFFLDVGRGGANDEAAQPVLALAGDDALQALALFVGGDLARDADVIHRRHVNQEASGQRDVAGDARALLADGLLGNLDQDLLPFLQQVGDERLITIAAACARCYGAIRRDARDRDRSGRHGARSRDAARCAADIRQ